jgi:hypothetical protein
MLLVYVWGDRFWFAAYQTDLPHEVEKIAKIIHPNWYATLWGLAIIVAAVIFKKFGPHPYHEGFPGYFTVLTLGFITPIFIFFDTVKPLINWRAFSLTFFSLQLVSVLWEATLGVPYQWWIYNPHQMLGFFIGAWANLPIEAPLLWIVAGLGIVILFEVIRIYLCMHRSYRDAFLGYKK